MTMLERIDIAVANDDGALTFAFARPVTVYTFIVAKKDDGEIVWDVSPAAMRSVKVARSTMHIARLGDSSSDAVAEVQRAAENAPVVEQPLRAIKYGELPANYKERGPAPHLNRGTAYNVIMIGKEGHATTTFVHESPGR